MRIAVPAGGSGLGGVRFNQRVVEALQARMGGDLDVIRVASLRAVAPEATRRLPMSAFEGRSQRTMRAVGGLVWGGRPIHRMDVRLPPARNEVVTVLDLAPLHYDDEGGLPPWVISSIRDSRGALCLSPSVAEEVMRIADVTTWVTGAGIDDRFVDAEPLDEGALAALGVPGPFALSVGGTTTRKNLGLLRDCWPLVRREADLHLVSVGPNVEQRRLLFRDVPGVVVLDQVADAVVPGLLAAARVLVVPSLYEGFGLPLVEAMGTGTPAVAVDGSSLAWVAGEAALLVEPAPEPFADAVLTAHGDDRVRERLRTDGAARRATFSWDEVARAHVAAYEDAFG